MPSVWQTVASSLQPVVKYLQQPGKPDQTLFPQRAMSGPLSATELLAIIEGRTSGEGLTVSEYTALNLSAVWCAVTNIAGTVGKLPLILYKRRSDGGRDRYDDHRLYRILHDEPHPEMGAMVFRETLQAHVLLWGNGYAEILRDQSDRVAALALITPNRVTPRRDDKSGALYYDVLNARGGATVKLAPRDMLHVRGLSFDGITGYSIVGKARMTLTLGLHTERFGSALFSNGPKWPGILQHPKTYRPETKAALRADLKGLPPGDFPILEEGLTWISTGMPAKDAEFLATRQFQVEEIARWFNMPPHKLKDLLRATFSNIEHQGIDYLTDTIDPWLCKWEEEINRKVIAPLESRIQYAEFLRDALQQADMATRNAALKDGILTGWLSRDEARAKLNMNPIPDGLGKDFLVPANMLPADKLGEVSDLPNLEPVDTTPTPAPETQPARQEPPAPDYATAATKMLDSTLAAIERERAASPGWDPETLAPKIADQIRALMVPPPAASNGHAHLKDDERAAIVEAVVSGLRAAPIEPPAPIPPPPPSTAVLLAQRALIADVVRRMHAREKTKLVTAAKTPERLSAWIGDFYPKHAEVFHAQLLRAITLHLAITGSTDDPDLATRVLVEDYLEESKRQLSALLDGQPADVASAVGALIARWEAERLGVIPDAVMREEMAAP